MRIRSLVPTLAVLAAICLAQATAAAGDNTPPEGFTALFNGRDLTGWQGLAASPVKKKEMSVEELAAAQAAIDAVVLEHWQAKDGVLVYDGQRIKGQSLSLCTKQQYGDFELLVDWKIGPEGDSGIYLRGTPQIQIWDPKLRGIGSGGIFNNKENPAEPLTTADKPIGEWNTFRIRMQGAKVTVWLNETKVVDNVTMENFWERGTPIYATGSIELQDHGNPLYFKNIYVRELK